MTVDGNKMHTSPARIFSMLNVGSIRKKKKDCSWKNSTLSIIRPRYSRF